MKKRILSLVLAVVMLLGLLPMTATPVQAITITSASDVSGFDFTGNAALAQKLDSIFAGNASIYSNASCTSPVNTALGTYSVPNDIQRYVGTYGNYHTTGWSCWVYGNGVYFTLFGVIIGNGDAGYYNNSEIISLSGTKKLTYANLKAWGVSDGVGAYVRIETDSWAHSFVILGYDENELWYIDGNGDGNGLVAVRKESWASVASAYNTRGTVLHIIQPTKSYMDATYPGHSRVTCDHTYSSTVTQGATCTEAGVKTFKCSKCGDSYTEAIPATGHHYNNWSTTTAATCITNGVQESVCPGCGDKKTQTIAATGHSYTSQTVEATCQDYKKSVYTCTSCKATYSQYSDDIAGEWSLTKPTGDSTVESQTQYRYRIKEYTTSTESALDGWRKAAFSSSVPP